MASQDDTLSSRSLPRYNFIDRTGQRFGRWVVVSRAPNHLHGAQWLCRCDCGTERVVAASRLARGRSQSCGCAPHKMTPILERFFAFVHKDPSGCWVWTGGIMQGGYALFYVYEKGRRVPAHIFAYTHFVGPLPQGSKLTHRCSIRHCVNPEHLGVIMPQVKPLPVSKPRTNYNFVDRTGQRYGRLLVLSQAPKRHPRRSAQWLCRCDCGKDTIVNATALSTGETQSCGCLQRELTAQRRFRTAASA
jgi:hypothetical protein